MQWKPNNFKNYISWAQCLLNLVAKGLPEKKLNVWGMEGNKGARWLWPLPWTNLLQYKTLNLVVRAFTWNYKTLITWNKQNQNCCCQERCTSDQDDHCWLPSNRFGCTIEQTLRSYLTSLSQATKRDRSRLRAICHD